MMKHISKIVITLALCLVMLWPQTALAAPSASLSGDSSIQAGSDVTLTLKVSGSNVMGVEAYAKTPAPQKQRVQYTPSSAKFQRSCRVNS